MPKPDITYTQTYSARKKAFLDGISLFFIASLTGYGTVSVWKTEAINNAQLLAYVFISIVCGLLTIILILAAFFRMHSIPKYKSNWHLYIDSKIIEFSSPDRKEAESFAFDMVNVKKFEREEFEDEDTSYRWNMYAEEKEGIKKIELDLGPFSVEEAVNHIKAMDLQHIAFEPKPEKVPLKSQILNFLIGIFYLGGAIIIGILFVLLLMSLLHGHEVFSDAFGFVIDTIRASLSL